MGIRILIGAFLMFAVASLDSVLGAGSVLGSFASSGVPPQTEEPPPLPPPPDTPGTCLTWNPRRRSRHRAGGLRAAALFEQARAGGARRPASVPTRRRWRCCRFRCSRLFNASNT
ncbi:hypothetical protein HBB16_08585 [Pseudonocardia sp. MCCB 268]|nr:hypothetical protein [Pseudonocardia cytotoxica]